MSESIWKKISGSNADDMGKNISQNNKTKEGHTNMGTLTANYTTNENTNTLEAIEAAIAESKGMEVSVKSNDSKKRDPRSNEIFQLAPSEIDVVPGFNPRNFELPENIEHVETLSQSIAEVGQKYPCVVYKGTDGRWKLEEGESRKRAVELNVSRGLGILGLLCTISRNKSEDMRLAGTLTSNSGKHLNPVELMRVVTKLIDVYGWKRADVLKKCAIPASRLLQAEALQALPTPILDLVEKGVTTAATGINVYKEEGTLSNALKALQDGQKVAEEARGEGARVMPKDVAEGKHRAENEEEVQAKLSGNNEEENDGNEDRDENAEDEGDGIAPRNGAKKSGRSRSKTDVATEKKTNVNSLNDKMKHVLAWLHAGMWKHDDKEQLMAGTWTINEMEDLMDVLGLDDDSKTECKQRIKSIKGKVSRQ